MKLGRLNHIGVATHSIADSVVYCREVIGAVQVTVRHPWTLMRARVCIIRTL